MSQEIKICSDASAYLLGGLSAQDTISTDKLSVACGFKKPGGTSSQFLKADGSTDAQSYTTCTGTFDTAGGGLSASGSTVAVDGSLVTTLNQSSCPGINCTGVVETLAGSTGISVTGTAATKAVAVDSTCNTTWNSAYTTTKNLSGCAGLACTGDIEGVTAGAGLSGGGTSGSVTVALDGAMVATLNQSGCLGLDCTGVVETIAGSTGIDVTGTAATKAIAVDSTCNTRWNGTATTVQSNSANWDQSALESCAGLDCVGDVTGVTVGPYLTGGGTSGSFEIGIDSACAAAWDGASAGGVTNVTGGDGIDSTGGTTPDISVDNTVVRTSGTQTIAGCKNFTNTSIDFAGGIYVGDAIYHCNDTNTGIQFITDNINFCAGGVNLLNLEEDPSYQDRVIVNCSGVDADFQVLDSSSGNLIYADAATSTVGIGTGTLSAAFPATLTVGGSISANGAILSGGVNIAEMFGGGGSGVDAGTACKLTKYNAAGTNVEDSIVTESTSLIDINGSLCTDRICSMDASNNLKIGAATGAGGITNIGIGCNAANAMTAGFNNIAIGTNSASLANSTCCNVTIGVEAGQDMTTGADDNVAIGTHAMKQATGANDNVIIGKCALGVGIATGACNVGIGFESMMNAVGACNNSSIGAQSMRAIVSGTFNTAHGFKALCSLVGGDRNTAVGAVAGQSITSGDDNTAVGFRALCGAVTGCYNVAMGRQAMAAVVTGNDNVGIGQNAMLTNTAGCCNVAVGHEAMCGNTTGAYNVSIGQQSMRYSLSGDHNMAIGQYALYDNWGGDYNTAVGTAAMQCNTTGSNNAALGYRAMFSNTTGNDNFAVGECALQSNVNGIGNTAVGHNAFGCNVTGNYTVALGDNAGTLQTDSCTALSASSDSIYIGRDTRGKSNDDSNSIVIGYNACSCGQNTIKLGNGSITAACIQVAWTTVSDERDKTCIEDLDKGLEFIGDLKPKSFEYRKDRTTTKGTGVKRYGFLAQDVLAAEGGDNVIVSEKNEDQLGLNSDYLVPILVKAVQELEARVAELEGN